VYELRTVFPAPFNIFENYQRHETVE